jgi:DNA polymerase I-like protein with 3'-5' exonuclease and polymerase domains
MIELSPQLFTPAVPATPQQVIPDLRATNVVAVDIETHDPYLAALGPGTRRGGFICGIPLATDKGSCYLPLRHASGNMEVTSTIGLLKDAFRDYKGTIVGANLQYDLDYLWSEGIETPLAAYWDIQIADCLSYELEESYSLEALCSRYKIPGKQAGELEAYVESCGKKSDMAYMALLPAGAVYKYAKWDAIATLEIYRKQQRSMALPPVVELEMKLIPIILGMTRRGVRVDLNALANIELLATARIASYLSLVGTNVAVEDIRSSSRLAAILNKSTGHRFPIRNGRPSVTAAELEAINHPDAMAAVSARKWLKLRDTFCDSIRRHEANGRIHASFHQVRGEKYGVSFGRMSSSHPNIQQMPVRHEEFGKMWRSIFVPDEGMKWATLDYSAQEPRWSVHFAAHLNLYGAKAFRDKWNADPEMDVHQTVADMCHIKKAAAKTINLGLQYGMGADKLSHSLGHNGQAILDQYNLTFPFIRQLLYKIRDMANSSEFIQTIGGRRCHFKADKSDTYKALNRLIQGSAADQMKTAILRAAQAGARLQLTVHDELCLSVNGDDEVAIVKSAMINAIPCSVVTMAKVSVGDNWGTKS